MYYSVFDMLVSFDDGSGNERVMLDDELQQEIIEQEEWGDDYEGGFLYQGDYSEYEGLTILDHPHIDGAGGSVSAMPLYNWE